MSDVPVLGAAAARERASQPEPEQSEEDQAPQIVRATTAFLVMWINGQVVVTANLDAPIAMDHYPTADEIAGAAAVLYQDRGAEKTGAMAAQDTVELIETKQREAIDAMRAAQEEARNKAAGEALLAAERAGKNRG